jgi:hypothetical protein
MKSTFFFFLLSVFFLTATKTKKKKRPADSKLFLFLLWSRTGQKNFESLIGSFFPKTFFLFLRGMKKTWVQGKIYTKETKKPGSKHGGKTE